jgi:hypothetical protein
MPNERHGDDRHLIVQDLQAAAEANGNTLQETWKNIQNTMQQQVGRPDGQREGMNQRP